MFWASWLFKLFWVVSGGFPLSQVGVSSSVVGDVKAFRVSSLSVSAK